MPNSVSRQSQTQRTASTSSTATTGKTKKPATTEQAQTTKAAGWGPKGNAGALKITAARIGDGPKTTDTVSMPKGFTAKLDDIKQKATDKVHGQEVSIEQSGQTLTVSGGGKTFSIGGDKAAIDQTAADWKAEVAAAKKEPANEFMQLNWFGDTSIRGAGTAGKLFSTMEGGSIYTGGAHPSNGTALSTYDARTGKEVKLDELLTPQQMNALVKDIGTKLPKLKGPDGMEGSTWSWGTPEDLRRTINENFALTTDKTGKVQIQVAWESGVHALGGQMAHFTIDAPNDAAFRAKIGLD